MQISLQATLPSKHSQYFFRQDDFRHLHPTLCVTPAPLEVESEEDAQVGLYLESKALGFLSNICWIETFRIIFSLDVFSHEKQRHMGPQTDSTAKH